jgi:hypothetical protein
MSYMAVVLFLFLAEYDICDGLTSLVKVSHRMSSSSSVPTGITLCKANEQLKAYAQNPVRARVTHSSETDVGEYLIVGLVESKSSS